MTYLPKNRQNKMARGIEHDYDLEQGISLDDLVQEIDLQEERLKKLKDERRKSSKRHSRNVFLRFRKRFFSRPSSQVRRIEEVSLTPDLERRIDRELRRLEKHAKSLTHSNENAIRGKIVMLLGSSFLVTLIISGCMTWFAATNPETVNGQLIKDWTNTMTTAEVGFISAVLGYYFGVIDRNKPRRNNPDSDQSQDR